MEIVIVGAGDIGFHLAKRLSFDKHNITIIESDCEKVKNANVNLDAKIVEGFGSSHKSLKDARTENADIFAALTNNDEVNLIACRIAKTMGAKTTVARVRNPEFKSKDFVLTPEELGCDFIIQPEKQAANRIVRLIRQSNATDIVDFADGKIQFIGIALDDNTPILNIPFKELGKTFTEPAMRVLAIRRKQFTLIPGGDDVLKSGDRIYIITESESMKEVLRIFGKSEKKNSSILLIGGGLIGEYIAKELEEEMNLKII
ncbi:MAG: NAD-binding protein, partial [Chlorobi bacterium]|nr:NAD-binding protein [Chlorobiota bacterium]